MIEIDDAGSGSLIGGTGIGVMRIETGEYLFQIVPLEYFQQPYFSKKKYQVEVIHIVSAIFRELQVTRSEEVHVCRGYIFDELRRWMAQENYLWQDAKIVGLLQEKVESSFNYYVIGLGLPKNFIQHARYAFGFHRLMKWVLADFEERSRLCKTGWKSWDRWSRPDISQETRPLTSDRYCLKCGNLIRKNETAVILSYTTTKPWSVELHPDCWSAKENTVR